jgi:predicted transcriptional regulator
MFDFEELDLGNYRSRLDIIADILQVVSQKPKKTQIMYQANLSYKVLMKYLKEVRNASLINFEHEKKCYRLTSKGNKFLEAYKRYSRHQRQLERQQNEAENKKQVLEELCSKT